MEYFDRESKVQFRADLIDLSEGEVVVLGRRNLCSRAVLYVKTVVKKTGIVRVLDNMPMSRQCRKVAIKYGSSVLSYYQLLRMLALMNLVIFIPWLVLAVIPWFKYWEPKGYKAGATLGLGGDVAAGALTALTLDSALNATVTGAVVPTSLVRLVNGTLAPPFVLRYKDDMVDPSDLVRNIFGLPVTDRTDTTFFFYPSYLNEFDGTKMGSWWVVLVLLTYTGSLLFVVLHIGHSLARGNLSGHVTPESRLPMSLFAWDWQVRDAQAVREKMTGCWMECLAEYYALMRSASLFEGQTVEARKGKYDPWWRCEIVSIDGVDCWVQPVDSSAGGSGGGSGAGVDGEAVKFLVTDVDNIKEVTTCGLSARAWRRIAGSFLSLLLCGGAVAGFYFSLFNKEDLDKDFPFTSALVVKAVNICIPFLQRLIVKYERIADPQAAIAQEVMRVFFIKMVGLVFVFISLVRLKESGEIGVGVCADYLVGATLWQLAIVDYYVDFLGTIGKAIFDVYIKKKRAEFVVSTEVINAMVRQGLTWMAALYSPVVPFFSFVYMVFLFFLKAKAMMFSCRTPSEPMSGEGAEALYYGMLLVLLAVCGLPFFYFMREDKEQCGPHLVPECLFDKTKCINPLKSLTYFVDETGLEPGTDWVFSSIILFVVTLALLVAVYLLLVSSWTRAEATRRLQNDLKLEMKHLRHEHQELLSLTGSAPHTQFNTSQPLLAPAASSASAASASQPLLGSAAAARYTSDGEFEAAGAPPPPPAAPLSQQEAPPHGHPLAPLAADAEAATDAACEAEKKESVHTAGEPAQQQQPPPLPPPPPPQTSGEGEGEEGEGQALLEGRGEGEEAAAESPKAVEKADEAAGAGSDDEVEVEEA